MPNHVVNELIFRDVSKEAQDQILAVAMNKDGEVDFEVLVPAPLNIWWGSVGSRHEKAFQDTHLDWARRNWGTKWNAYSHKPVARTADSLTLTFETAWRPPYGWLAALVNKLALSFDHNWLDEGASRGVAGRFEVTASDSIMGPVNWTEEPCGDEMQRHLHFLHWGVEEFPPEEDDTQPGTERSGVDQETILPQTEKGS